MEQNEQEYWTRFLNKNISLVKSINEKELYYQGLVIKVLPDKIILDDRKIGEIPLAFDGLSVIAINKVQQC